MPCVWGEPHSCYIWVGGGGLRDTLSPSLKPSWSSWPLNLRLQSDHFKGAIKKPLSSVPWHCSQSAARPAANQTIRSHFMKSSRSARSSSSPSSCRSRPQGEVPICPPRSDFAFMLAVDKSRNFSLRLLLLSLPPAALVGTLLHTGAFTGMPRGNELDAGLTCPDI